MTRIQELASIISTNTDRIDAHLTSRGLPTPSFDADAPESLDLPSDLQAARVLVIEASTELKELLQGPKELLMSNSSSQFVSLRAIYHYKMAETFPVGSEATFVQISEACGLNEPDVRRILRHAMAHRIFREVRKGVVVHTAASRLLAESRQLKSWTGVNVEEMWPAAVQTVPAMIKWPNSQEATHTGFSIANDTQDSIFVTLGKDPKRAARFGEGMSAFNTSGGYELDHLVNHKIWSTLGYGLVVDLGGSHGDAMIALAMKYPSLKFVVQDLPRTIESRPTTPPNVADRVEFLAHDFFEEQPIKHADLYFFRWIFHDWSDEYCVRILRNLIPALKHKSRMIINDACLPEPNTLSNGAERQIRSMDLAMLQIQNSRERELQDWETLFVKADPRFKFLGVTQPKGSKLAIIEAIWEPVV
ncbi:S-adenosyl-L-methionine-dependent methyltransferase [Glarea lozoyensis ATCC 20868]|uniref:S-adenosyl-L-methionine-dependent methyltransferase n=1 Tax=Glarea lozoyensis (strain ATCC 20868 / MF5171) TaxID=1116229 RepID=S3CQU5_GLAL2|nr:S-adenosyl-L-methionine-dependent methyltransferase [Glarea lozoyensis ATCC 20868]EPE27494.1 S-adenosyl-L-methionine-dependent methyltransferase [Glarea lozoyensis ATCC 20868]